MTQDLPENDEPKTSVNTGYVLGQLSRAMSAAAQHSDPAVRQRASERTQRWEQVFQAMLNSTVSFGTRAPVQGVPEWTTLEVLHGGFATGNLLAGGVLQPFELELLRQLGRPADDTARAALNIYYLSEQGQQGLSEMIQTGRYRVNVPEEGALLIVAWLLAHDMSEKAQELVDVIAPFFDRLRFFPIPTSFPFIPSPTVHRWNAGQAIESLQAREQQVQVAQMMESLKVWQPLYDRTVSLFLETIEVDLPCCRFPEGWQTRAQALLDEYNGQRKIHRLCRKPDKPKENFFRLRGYLRKSIDLPEQMTDQDRRVVRHILRCYATRHGLPGSDQLRTSRAEQARITSLPTYGELTQVVIARLQRFPAENGVPNFDFLAGPVADAESTRFKIPSAAIIPDCLSQKALRCWEAPIEQLVEKGVIPSGEVLAQVLPQITSQVRAAGIRDQDLRRCYGTIYSVFRRRRSLLLLNLERQVRFEDLPWIAVLNDLRQDDIKVKDGGYQVLEQVTTIAIKAFPYAILPNKLLQELRTLVKTAELEIPILDELAADIFMGAFTEKFLAAAKIAGKLLRGTLYEQYYGVDYGRILQLDDIEEKYGAKTSPGFAAMCQELAQVKNDSGRSVARNGKIIEQSQVLTTQNLAPLFAALNLHPTFSGRLRELSENCFRWILKRQISGSWKANLRMVKNSAYAWRQMVFFLSFLDEAEILSFVQWMRIEALRKKSPCGQRLEPALVGLELVANGGSLAQQVVSETSQGRPFLGWTTERHWLLGPERKEAAP